MIEKLEMLEINQKNQIIYFTFKKPNFKPQNSNSALNFE